MSDEYTTDEQAQLLALARQSLRAAAAGESRAYPNLETLSPRLCEQRACFVTLMIGADLRGCTGTLAARRSLAEEVAVTTAQTALNDPRFSAVTVGEVPRIHIEISVLTPSQPLKFNSPDEIPRLLRPLIDGVTLRLGPYRSTFLPQVWERVPDPLLFLSMLSRKMGLPGDAWRHEGIEVEIYQTVIIEDHESDPAEV
jgi:AmmeMemoRadiSam system protein A